MKTLFLSVIIFVLAVTISFAQDETVPRYEPLDECFQEMPEDVDYDCGFVIVPEFHGVDNGRTLEIGVIRLNALSETSAEPIFLGAGGPGGSILPFASTFPDFLESGTENFFVDMWAERDLIFIAHRGTEHTEPHLSCEANAEMFQEALLNNEDPFAAQIEALKTCYDDYVAAGVDVAAFNSEQIAADFNSIREIFEYDQIIYYGESYGTVLGQHIMRQYPETLSTVILDGALPISFPSWSTNTDVKFRGAIDYVTEVCAADAACNEAFPDFAEDIEAVHDQLAEAPLEVTLGDVTIPVTAELYAVGVYNAFYTTSFTSFLPGVVDELARGEVSELGSAIIFSAIPPARIGWGMHFATVCSEDPTTSLDDARSPESEQVGIIDSYIASDAGAYVELCAYMDLPVFPDETDDAPIESDIPTLIISGGFDPVTPEVFALWIQDTLTTSYAYTMPYKGHVQLLTGGPCIADIAMQFLSDPMTEPDASCIADEEPIGFLVPEDE